MHNNNIKCRIQRRNNPSIVRRAVLPEISTMLIRRKTLRELTVSRTSGTRRERMNAPTI